MAGEAGRGVTGLRGREGGGSAIRVATFGGGEGRAALKARGGAQRCPEGGGGGGDVGGGGGGGGACVGRRADLDGGDVQRGHRVCVLRAVERGGGQASVAGEAGRGVAGLEGRGGGGSAGAGGTCTERSTADGAAARGAAAGCAAAVAAGGNAAGTAATFFTATGDKAGRSIGGGGREAGRRRGARGAHEGRGG